MIEYDNLFQLLETIRIQKNISVESLTKDVISPKSYYTYLKESVKPPIKVFEVIASRLNIDYSQILHNAFFLKKDERIPYNYIRRVHSFQTNDTDKLYQSFKDYKGNGFFEQQFVYAYNKKFENINDKISKDEYRNELINVIDSMTSYEANLDKNNVKGNLGNNIYFLNVISLYFQISDKLFIISNGYSFNDSDIALYFINYDNSSFDFYYLIALENFIVSSIRFSCLQKDLIQTLINIYFSITTDYESKFVIMFRAFFKAYNFELMGDIENRNKQLTIFYNGCNVICSGERYDRLIDVLKEAFGKDIIDTIINKSSELINACFEIKDLYN